MIVFLLFVGLLIIPVSAEKIGVETKNNYIPGEELDVRITLYDDDSEKIEGLINYKILDYYSDIVNEGQINSGEKVSYILPSNAEQGPWKIIANYNDVSSNVLFNVDKLETAEIKLEGDVLVVTNIGNTEYNKKILIYVGQEDQTADIYLDIGQTKRIRLTAPDGDYDIRVIEGSGENLNELEFKGVQLTGNVVGLESVIGENSFWKKYPMVSVFLGVLLLIVIVIVVLKLVNKKK